jgi:acetyltransferase-like isoleucine patch superfamily enzyme
MGLLLPGDSTSIRGGRLRLWFARWIVKLARPELETMIDWQRLHGFLNWGPPGRLSVHPTAEVCNALFNTLSGTIVVEKYVAMGQNVTLATGSHDMSVLGAERQRAVAPAGRDIVVGEGAFVGSGAIILGPCVIGKHAVVAAGSLVRTDVSDFEMVAGVPAKTVRSIRPGARRD